MLDLDVTSIYSSIWVSILASICLAIVSEGTDEVKGVPLVVPESFVGNHRCFAANFSQHSTCVSAMSAGTIKGCQFLSCVLLIVLSW